MRQIVDRHGGTVEKFVGDEVMAVFGVPSHTKTTPSAASEPRKEMLAGSRV